MQNGRQFSKLNHQHRNKFIILLTISFLPWKQASNSQEACSSSRSYLRLAELKDKRIVMQKPDLSWKTGRNKDYQVYSLQSRSYFSLHLGTETWNSWVEGLFAMSYTFWILNVWIYYYLFTTQYIGKWTKILSHRYYLSGTVFCTSHFSPLLSPFGFLLIAAMR